MSRTYLFCLFSLFIVREWITVFNFCARPLRDVAYSRLRKVLHVMYSTYSILGLTLALM